MHTISSRPKRAYKYEAYQLMDTMIKLSTANEFVVLMNEIISLARSQQRSGDCLGRAVTYRMLSGRLCIGFEHGYVELDANQLREIFDTDSNSEHYDSNELCDGIDLNSWT